MAQTVTLNAERRSGTGTGAARQLRRQGQIPAIIYGHGRQSEALAVAQMDLDKVLHDITGATVIELALDGHPVRVLIREIQRHPTKKTVTHVDFYEIHAGEKITLGVPVNLVGSPDGVRNAGGVLEQFLREIEIEVLPQHIPERIDVDVTELGVGSSLHVEDVMVANAKILTDPETTVCTVVPPRVEEAPPVEVVEEEEEVAEPELIRKPKAEEEAQLPEGEPPKE
ncbi:MAG: 50S ribosomal protein L25 [Gemmatimonadales bacterium]|nr:50S ribosomal protein L25 [Gemmatimonadales bacterium]NIN12341.1 50S ribosomal protein L25 [Gemmatimonadales bacterium]NIN48879.1 50S ribosomal protein L25 [Gemmatimonadales bacterium]NIP06343.1 50S ribosomal protein L25 [Gemmatimonadales bacterium]NIR00715.1 50S ribosomal protein L25 [Gemmatimonadales bacterium]